MSRHTGAAANCVVVRGAVAHPIGSAQLTTWILPALGCGQTQPSITTTRLLQLLSASVTTSQLLQPLISMFCPPLQQLVATRNYTSKATTLAVQVGKSIAPYLTYVQVQRNMDTCRLSTTTQQTSVLAPSVLWDSLQVRQVTFAFCCGP